MNSNAAYQLNSKENLYFFIKLIISAGLYALIFLSINEAIKSEDPEKRSLFIVYITIATYIVMILGIVYVHLAITIGHLRGNAIKITANQFPEIHQLVVKHSRTLGLMNTPDVYIRQSGGILNAFTSRFMGHNYIVLYSDIVEAALEQDKHILSFIIGHELGHIKRKHIIKKLLLLPSAIIPFLEAAYSRACEYTCDAIGHSLSPVGTENGLLLLAAGKTVFKKVNLREYVAQQYTEAGFWTWFAEKISSHPNLTKRLACFTGLRQSAVQAEPVIETIVPEPKKQDDYSRYMPQ